MKLLSLLLFSNTQIKYPVCSNLILKPVYGSLCHMKNAPDEGFSYEIKEAIKYIA